MRTILPKIDLFFTIILCAYNFLSSSAVEDCEDRSTTVDIGWEIKPKCKYVGRKFPKFCQNKNVVKYTCAATCGDCDFNPCSSCVDSKGKFKQGSTKKKCKGALKNPKLCTRDEFKFNCPKTCGLCGSDCELDIGSGGSTGEGGSGGGGGENGTSTECSGGAPDCCLGLTKTCDLRVDELFYAAMHNANNDEDKWNSNHEGSLENALEAGFRAFYLDVCLCQGQVVFCHGNCFFAGTQDPIEIFSNVVQFLDNNPSEVVVFNFEISWNNPTPQMLWDVMKQINGLEEKSYVHNGGSWPTIGDILQNGKQIISLKHNGENCWNTSNVGCTKYIQEFFKYTVGTEYTFRNVDEIEDTSRSCVGKRGTGNLEQFYAINNFITLAGLPGPSETGAMHINQDSFLEKRIADCEKIMGMPANFVAIDFWQHGNLPSIAKKINKERADKRRR